MYTIDENNKITIVKKDTAYFAIAHKNYNFSQGDTITFTIARQKESQEPLVQKRITDFMDNTAIIYLSSQHTNLDKGIYFYDIQLDTADGWVDTLVGPCKFKVIQGVTY